MYLMLVWKYIQRNYGAGKWFRLVMYTFATYMMLLDVAYIDASIITLVIWHDHDINSEQSISHLPWELPAYVPSTLPVALSHSLLTLTLINKY